MNLPIASANLPLTVWQNFYVIVGSSAGALIGLQFVVLALVGSTRKRTNAETIVLNEPGSLFYPRYNQLDMNVRKTWRVRGKQLTGQFDLFNVTNEGAIFTENNSVGASLGR